MEEVLVKIVSWGKYNPRKDIKLTHWLRLQHNFFEDPSFYDFTPEERLCWIYLLCERSKRNPSPEIPDYFTVNIKHFHRVTGMNTTVCKSTIKKLQKERLVEVRTLRGRYVHGTDTCSTRRDETGRNVTGRDETRRDQAGTDPNALLMQAVPASPLEPSLTLQQQIWSGYLKAYETRYGKPPVRNATVNSQISSLGKRLGVDAIDVIKFYVAHNKGYYVERCHPVGACLADAEALHTQWVRGRAITRNDIRQFESQDHVRSQLERIEKGEL